MARLAIHDAGASNGITSWELFQLLSTERCVDVYATDYYDRLYLVELREQGWTIVFDVERRPLQAVGGRWVLSMRRPHPWRHPVNRWIQQRVRRDILPMAQSALERKIDQRDPARGSESATSVREVSLFHPRCIQAAAEQHGFHIGRHSVFEPNPYRCHIVRALNVITTKHFSSDQVRRGIEALAHNIEPGGLVILGRSIDEEDGRLRATAFSVDGSQLTAAWHLHGGYEDLELASAARVLCEATAVSG